MNGNCAPAVYTIFLGDEKPMYLVVRLPNGTPYSLESCTELVISLPKADGTFAQLKLSDNEVTIQSPAVLGEFSANITTEISELLQVGELQSFDVSFTTGSEINTVRYLNALSVFEPQPY